MMPHIRLYFIIACCFLLAGCMSKKEKNIQSANKKLNGPSERLIIEMSLLEQTTGSRQNTSQDNRKGDYTLFLSTNVSCADCLYTLNKLDSLLADKKYETFHVKAICHSHNNFEYFKFLLRTNKLANKKIEYLLDTANAVRRQNSFLNQQSSNIAIITDSVYQIAYWRSFKNEQDVIDVLSQFLLQRAN